jgi:hypothetical protein
MGIYKKENEIKKLKKSIKKHESNPNIVKKLKGKLASLENKK